MSPRSVNSGNGPIKSGVGKLPSQDIVTISNKLSSLEGKTITTSPSSSVPITDASIEAPFESLLRQSRIYGQKFNQILTNSIISRLNGAIILTIPKIDDVNNSQVQYKLEKVPGSSFKYKFVKTNSADFINPDRDQTILNMTSSKKRGFNPTDADKNSITEKLLKHSLQNSDPISPRQMILFFEKELGDASTKFRLSPPGMSPNKLYDTKGLVAEKNEQAGKITYTFYCFEGVQTIEIPTRGTVRAGYIDGNIKTFSEQDLPDRHITLKDGYFSEVVDGKRHITLYKDKEKQKSYEFPAPTVNLSAEEPLNVTVVDHQNSNSKQTMVMPETLQLDANGEIDFTPEVEKPFPPAPELPISTTPENVLSMLKMPDVNALLDSRPYGIATKITVDDYTLSYFSDPDKKLTIQNSDGRIIARFDNISLTEGRLKGTLTLIDEAGHESLHSIQNGKENKVTTKSIFGILNYLNKSQETPLTIPIITPQVTAAKSRWNEISSVASYFKDEIKPDSIFTVGNTSESGGRFTQKITIDGETINFEYEGGSLTSISITHSSEWTKFDVQITDGKYTFKKATNPDQNMDLLHLKERIVSASKVEEPLLPAPELPISTTPENVLSMLKMPDVNALLDSRPYGIATKITVDDYTLSYFSDPDKKLTIQNSDGRIIARFDNISLTEGRLKGTLTLIDEAGHESLHSIQNGKENKVTTKSIFGILNYLNKSQETPLTIPIITPQVTAAKSRWNEISSVASYFKDEIKPDSIFTVGNTSESGGRFTQKITIDGETINFEYEGGSLTSISITHSSEWTKFDVQITDGKYTFKKATNLEQAERELTYNSTSVEGLKSLMTYITYQQDSAFHSVIPGTGLTYKKNGNDIQIYDSKSKEYPIVKFEGTYDQSSDKLLGSASFYYSPAGVGHNPRLRYLCPENGLKPRMLICDEYNSSYNFSEDGQTLWTLQNTDTQIYKISYFQEGQARKVREVVVTECNIEQVKLDLKRDLTLSGTNTTTQIATKSISKMEKQEELSSEAKIDRTTTQFHVLKWVIETTLKNESTGLDGQTAPDDDAILEKCKQSYQQIISEDTLVQAESPAPTTPPNFSDAQIKELILEAKVTTGQPEATRPDVLDGATDSAFSDETLPNTGSTGEDSLLCGYIALAGGLTQVDHDLTSIYRELDIDPALIYSYNDKRYSSDDKNKQLFQKVIGHELYKYSQKNKSKIFQKYLDQFKQGLIKQAQIQNVRESSLGLDRHNPETHMSIEDAEIKLVTNPANYPLSSAQNEAIERLVAYERKEVIERGRDINRQRIEILAQELGFPPVYFNQEGDLSKRDCIRIHNPGGGHYEAYKIKSVLDDSGIDMASKLSLNSTGTNREFNRIISDGHTDDASESLSNEDFDNTFLNGFKRSSIAVSESNTSRVSLLLEDDGGANLSSETHSSFQIPGKNMSEVKRNLEELATQHTATEDGELTPKHKFLVKINASDETTPTMYKRMKTLGLRDGSRKVGTSSTKKWDAFLELLPDQEITSDTSTKISEYLNQYMSKNYTNLEDMKKFVTFLYENGFITEEDKNKLIHDRSFNPTYNNMSEVKRNLEELAKQTPTQDGELSPKQKFLVKINASDETTPTMYKRMKTLGLRDGSRKVGSSSTKKWDAFLELLPDQEITSETSTEISKYLTQHMFQNYKNLDDMNAFVTFLCENGCITEDDRDKLYYLCSVKLDYESKAKNPRLRRTGKQGSKEDGSVKINLLNKYNLKDKFFLALYNALDKDGSSEAVTSLTDLIRDKLIVELSKNKGNNDTLGRRIDDFTSLITHLKDINELEEGKPKLPDVFGVKELRLLELFKKKTSSKILTFKDHFVSFGLMNQADLNKMLAHTPQESSFLDAYKYPLTERFTTTLKKCPNAVEKAKCINDFYELIKELDFFQHQDEMKAETNANLLMMHCRQAIEQTPEQTVIKNIKVNTQYIDKDGIIIHINSNSGDGNYSVTRMTSNGNILDLEEFSLAEDNILSQYSIATNASAIRMYTEHQTSINISGSNGVLLHQPNYTYCFTEEVDGLHLNYKTSAEEFKSIPFTLPPGPVSQKELQEIIKAAIIARLDQPVTKQTKAAIKPLRGIFKSIKEACSTHLWEKLEKTSPVPDDFSLFDQLYQHNSAFDMARGIPNQEQPGILSFNQHIQTEFKHICSNKPKTLADKTYQEHKAALLKDNSNSWVILQSDSSGELTKIINPGQIKLFAELIAEKLNPTKQAMLLSEIEENEALRNELKKHKIYCSKEEYYQEKFKALFSACKSFQETFSGTEAYPESTFNLQKVIADCEVELARWRNKSKSSKDLKDAEKQFQAWKDVLKQSWNKPTGGNKQLYHDIFRYSLAGQVDSAAGFDTSNLDSTQTGTAKDFEQRKRILASLYTQLKQAHKEGVYFGEEGLNGERIRLKGDDVYLSPGMKIPTAKDSSKKIAQDMSLFKKLAYKIMTGQDAPSKNAVVGFAQGLKGVLFTPGLERVAEDDNPKIKEGMELAAFIFGDLLVEEKKKTIYAALNPNEQPVKQYGWGNWSASRSGRREWKSGRDALLKELKLPGTFYASPGTEKSSHGITYKQATINDQVLNIVTGDINSDKSKQILEGKPDGTYFIRESISQPSKHVLYYRQNSQTKDLLFELDGSFDLTQHITDPFQTQEMGFEEIATGLDTVLDEDPRVDIHAPQRTHEGVLSSSAEGERVFPARPLSYSEHMHVEVTSNFVIDINALPPHLVGKEYYYYEKDNSNNIKLVLVHNEGTIKYDVLESTDGKISLCIFNDEQKLITSKGDNVIEAISDLYNIDTATNNPFNRLKSISSLLHADLSTPPSSPNLKYRADDFTPTSQRYHNEILENFFETEPVDDGHYYYFTKNDEDNIILVFRAGSEKYTYDVKSSSTKSQLTIMKDGDEGTAKTANQAMKNLHQLPESTSPYAPHARITGNKVTYIEKVIGNEKINIVTDNTIDFNTSSELLGQGADTYFVRKSQSDLSMYVLCYRMNEVTTQLKFEIVAESNGLLIEGKRYNNFSEFFQAKECTPQPLEIETITRPLASRVGGAGPDSVHPSLVSVGLGSGSLSVKDHENIEKIAVHLNETLSCLSLDLDGTAFIGDSLSQNFPELQKYKKRVAQQSRDDFIKDAKLLRTKWELGNDKDPEQKSIFTDHTLALLRKIKELPPRERDTVSFPKVIFNSLNNVQFIAALLDLEPDQDLAGWIKSNVLYTKGKQKILSGASNYYNLTDPTNKIPPLKLGSPAEHYYHLDDNEGDQLITYSRVERDNSNFSFVHVTNKIDSAALTSLKNKMVPMADIEVTPEAFAELIQHGSREPLVTRLSDVQLETLTVEDIGNKLENYKDQIIQHVKRSSGGNPDDVITTVVFLLSSKMKYSEINTLQDAVEVATSYVRWYALEKNKLTGETVELTIDDAYGMWVAFNKVQGSSNA